jgi:hypothetical protein
MSFFNDAKHLVSDSKRTLLEIENAYQESLNQKNISPTLLIKIKNFMENLRSALDFTAHGIFDKYGDQSKSSQKIYFPYAREDLDLNGFGSKNYIEKCIPGLSNTRPDIVAKIESYQCFSDASHSWLPTFMGLSNENKHQRLTPQTRKEVKELRISSGNVGMRLSGGASIKISGNAQISMGNAIIAGNQTISPDSPAKLLGPARQEVITWVSFHFTDNDEPVIPLLKNALDGIESIVEELFDI